MTLYQYKMKSDNEQLQMLCHQGEIIHSENENGTNIKLFALGDFFIEAFYGLNSNEIIKKNEFRCGYLLDKYSQDVKALFDFK